MNRNCLIVRAGNETQLKTLINSPTKTAGVSPQAYFSGFDQSMADKRTKNRPDTIEDQLTHCIYGMDYFGYVTAPTNRGFFDLVKTDTANGLSTMISRGSGGFSGSAHPHRTIATYDAPSKPSSSMLKRVL